MNIPIPKTPTDRRSVNRAEAQLAFYAAACALPAPIDVDDLRKLSEITRDVHAVTIAVAAMKSAVDQGQPNLIVASAMAALTTYNENRG